MTEKNLSKNNLLDTVNLDIAVGMKQIQNQLQQDNDSFQSEAILSTSNINAPSRPSGDVTLFEVRSAIAVTEEKSELINPKEVFERPSSSTNQNPKDEADLILVNRTPAFKKESPSHVASPQSAKESVHESIDIKKAPLMNIKIN